MPAFRYTALQTDGTRVKGAITADSKIALTTRLEEKGLLLLSASKERVREEKAEPQPSVFKRNVRLDEKVLFTRQFATMFRAGIPVIRSLYILRDQTDNTRLQIAISAIARDVETGNSLADAFIKHPKIFQPLYCKMLAAGEASGNLNAVLEKLSDSMEYEHQIKSTVVNALIYPVFVILTLILAFILIMLLVVPKLTGLFDQLGGNLPLTTRFFIGISNLFTTHWPIMLILFGSLVASILITNKRERGQIFFGKLLLKAPLTGKLLNYSYMTRIAALLAILQSSGLLIVDSLRIVASCIQNTALKKEVEQASIDVEAGKSIAASLRKSQFFPIIMQSMISIGESSGNLEDMLKEASRHFETEVRYAVKRLTELLTPILIVIIAVFIGFFAIAFYVPFWDLLDMQWNSIE